MLIMSDAELTISRTELIIGEAKLTASKAKASISGPDLIIGVTNKVISVPPVHAASWRVIEGWKVNAIGTNLNVRFRTEFYNALNHTNFGLPIANISMPAAGLIFNTVTPSRQIQFGLSVSF